MEGDVQTRFETLQEKLVPLWRSIEVMNQDPQTIVVVPSLSVEFPEGTSIPQQPYEERYLFLLLLLRQPRARLVYVTSQPILPSVIDYYLDLLPGVIPSHARKRLITFPVHDGGPEPLSRKLLDRPRMIARLRETVADPDRAHMVPFNTTELERDLAVQLGIPMYGADPRHFPLGTKTGCRRVFEEEGVAHPAGVEDLWSADDLVEAIAGLRAAKPSMSQVIVKLNEGVSGEGNGLVDLADVPAPGDPGEEAAIRRALEAMEFELDETTYEGYMPKFAERGGIVEERIIGTDFRSPSVQMRITPLGEVELLSTHDQLLGGPSGQSYLGCIFPADQGYARLITEQAMKVGARLAREGVIGRFAIDFVTVRNADGEWEAHAVEINLRKGGTTHPFLTLQFLTDGTYDPDTAVFTAPSGQRKYFIASDHIQSPDYKGLSPDDLFDIVVRRGLHFDQSRQTGVVLHMMTGITQFGSLGMTAVGDSPGEAQATYDRAVEIIDEEAQEALAGHLDPR